MTLSQATYLDYKSDMQEGAPIVHFYGEKKEFIKLCDDLDIPIIEHEICFKCRKPIYYEAKRFNFGF